MARVGIPVHGALMRDANLALPERHLGLIQAGETADLDRRLDHLADVVGGSVDLERLVALARPTYAVAPASLDSLPPPEQRIALAFDQAFSFVYPHVLAGWRAAGAEIETFSPLADELPPPDCDACWLSGGYLELQATVSAPSRRPAQFTANAAGTLFSGEHLRPRTGRFMRWPGSCNGPAQGVTKPNNPKHAEV